MNLEGNILHVLTPLKKFYYKGKKYAVVIYFERAEQGVWNKTSSVRNCIFQFAFSLRGVIRVRRVIKNTIIQ